MSYLFDEAELDGMREAQENHMMDTCVVLSYAAETLNEFNEADAPTYTSSSAISCGLNMYAGQERRGGDMTVVQYDGVLRLPIGTTVKETDRIQITKRFGESITALTYEIVSPIERGPSGLRILLRKTVT